MSSTIEDTVKALVEFEGELDSAKSDAMDAKKAMAKKASDWADAARAKAVAEAQKIANDMISNARLSAEKEAEAMAKKGASALKTFEAKITVHEKKAASRVVARVIGERQ